MIDKDWLEEAISQQAEDKFDSMFDNLPPQLAENTDVRVAYQQLLHSQEFANLRKVAIPVIKKDITSNILNSLEGVKGLLDRGDK